MVILNFSVTEDENTNNQSVKLRGNKQGSWLHCHMLKAFNFHIPGFALFIFEGESIADCPWRVSGISVLEKKKEKKKRNPNKFDENQRIHYTSNVA